MGRAHAHGTHGSRGHRPHTRRPSVLLTGTIRVWRRDRAEVDTPEGTFRVARHGIREAMNGDEVQVSVSATRGGEKVARVRGVLTRATTTFVGTYGVAGPLGVIEPLDMRMAHSFYVVPEDRSAERLGVAPGDVVSARILEYPTRQSEATATIERRLGSASELDLGIEGVIASHGLATEFPEAALAQAERVRADVADTLARQPWRRDLRAELVVTVDPADARDFDDAVGARRLGEGEGPAGASYELSVHIADVTHYLPWDSPMDVEARRRGCSAYLADRVLPMLPERLCNDVCSLVPGEDRLAMSVRATLDAAGEVLSFEAFPSAIRSGERLSYDQVDAFLGGGALPEGTPGGVGELLRTLDELRRLREGVRVRRGAIDFDTVEARVVLDGDGTPTGASVRRRTAATGCIEEAMLVANECVATLLAEHDTPSAYRVHERPSPQDLAACVPALRELGVLGPGDVGALVAGEPAALRAVLARAEGTDAEMPATALLLRAQKRAVYLPHNDGHYALGARAYCHFTSPIRRYPDDVVHRTLKALLVPEVAAAWRDGLAAMGRALPQLCRSCSEAERVADAAARDSQKVKFAQLYGEHVGESFDGMVSGCVRHGLFVTLADTYAEGFLPVRALGAEWFAFDDARLTLTGEESGDVWRLGRRVLVRVTATDVPQGRIDLALA